MSGTTGAISEEVSSPPGEGKTIVLVGCGKQKQDTASPAHLLYTSNYFGLRREYAVEFADDWYVLSAKHGFVDPERTLEPYDRTFGDDVFNHDAFIDLLVAQIRRGDLDISEEDTLVVLAGVNYIQAVRDALNKLAFRFPEESVEFEVATPLQDAELGGLGEQMGWIRTRVDEESPLPDGDF